jgi:hypothetical protein
MAFTVTTKQIGDEQYNVFANDMHFATIYKPLPFKRKAGAEWTFRIEHLPVEAYTVYRDVPDALIAVENFINLLNRNV